MDAIRLVPTARTVRRAEHARPAARPSLHWVAMLALFGDESYDDYTYVLGGWLITPTHNEILCERWQRMLDTLKLADGSPCLGFHAQEIMSQSKIYEGWGKDEAF